MSSLSYMLLLQVLGASSLLSQNETAELEQRFRAWINGVETCSVAYDLVTEHYAPPEGVSPWTEEYYEYHYDRGDFSLQLPWGDEPGAESVLKAIWRDGACSHRYDKKGENGGVVTLAQKHWKFPPDVFFMPHEWLGYDLEGRNWLLTSLDAGTVYAFESSGLKVLSCWTRPQSQFTPFDAYLDENGTVLQIDTMMRLSVKTLEQLREFWSGDPLDYGHVCKRLEFLDYFEVNGFNFPLQVSASHYRMKNDAFRAVMDAYNRGDLSDNEYRLQAAQTWPRLELTLKREATIDATTLRVNEALPKDALELPYSASDLVSTGADKSLWKVPQWYDWIRNPWLWALAVFTLFGLSAALFRLRCAPGKA